MQTTRFCETIGRSAVTIGSRCCSHAAVASAPPSCEWNVRTVPDRFRLVIFNKFGTITRFHPGWLAWSEKQSRRLKPLIGFDSTKIIYRSVTGLYKRYLEENARGRGASDPSLDEIRLIILSQLRAVSKGDIDAAVTKVIEIPNESLDFNAIKKTQLIQPATDLPRLFHALKSRCIRIALNTTDSRANTISDLRLLKVLLYFDTLQCGDDPNLPSKPDAHRLFQLCKSMRVDPSETAVVSDAPEDLRMAEHINAGMRVGVMSGAVPPTELAPYADFLLPHIGYITPLVANQRSSPIVLAAATRSNVESSMRSLRAARC